MLSKSQVQFTQIDEPEPELQSGLGKFRFGPWFKTKPQQPYDRRLELFRHDGLEWVLDAIASVEDCTANLVLGPNK